MIFILNIDSGSTIIFKKGTTEARVHNSAIELIIITNSKSRN